MAPRRETKNSKLADELAELLNNDKTLTQDAAVAQIAEASSENVSTGSVKMRFRQLYQKDADGTWVPKSGDEPRRPAIQQRSTLRAGNPVDEIISAKAGLARDIRSMWSKFTTASKRLDAREQELADDRRKLAEQETEVRALAKALKITLDGDSDSSSDSMKISSTEEALNVQRA